MSASQHPSPLPTCRKIQGSATMSQASAMESLACKSI